MASCVDRNPGHRNSLRTGVNFAALLLMVAAWIYTPQWVHPGDESKGTVDDNEFILEHGMEGWSMVFTKHDPIGFEWPKRTNKQTLAASESDYLLVQGARFVVLPVGQQAYRKMAQKLAAKAWVSKSALKEMESKLAAQPLDRFLLGEIIDNYLLDRQKFGQVVKQLALAADPEDYQDARRESDKKRIREGGHAIKVAAFIQQLANNARKPGQGMKLRVDGRFGKGSKGLLRKLEPDSARHDALIGFIDGLSGG